MSCAKTDPTKWGKKACKIDRLMWGETHPKTVVGTLQ